MDHLVAAAIAQDRLNLGGAAACDAFGVLRAIGCEPARDLPAVAVAHQNRVTALEPAVDLAHTRREKALALTERLHGTGIDDERPFRLEHARDPALARRGRGGAGTKTRAPRTGAKRLKRIGTAFGDDDLTARGGGDLRCRKL